MQQQISLCRVWSNVRENRAALIERAVVLETDVRVFWEDPQGSQSLHQLEGFTGDLARVTETFQRHGFTRWIYESRLRRIVFLSVPEQENAGFKLLAELTGIAEIGFKLESRSVREERLNPLAREIYLHEAERPPESDGDTEPVEGWGFLVPWSPERREAVLVGREELIESLKRLTGIWEQKTGRRATPEEWSVHHRFLAATGFPQVVFELPAGAELEQCWQFRGEGEPDLVVSLYRVKAPAVPPLRLLHAALGIEVEQVPALVS